MDQVLKKKQTEAKNATVSQPVAPTPVKTEEPHKVQTIKLKSVSTTHETKKHINLTNYNQIKNNSSEVKKSTEIKLKKLNITAIGALSDQKNKQSVSSNETQKVI